MYAFNVRTRLGVYSSLEVDTTRSLFPQVARVVLECLAAKHSTPLRTLQPAADSSLATVHADSSEMGEATEVQHGLLKLLSTSHLLAFQQTTSDEL